MPRRKRNKVPARLERVHDQFMAWRKVRKRGERIPKRLWESAAKMASDYGLKRTATVLGLEGATAMPPSSGGSLIQFFLFPLDAVFNKVAPFAV